MNLESLSNLFQKQTGDFGRIIAGTLTIRARNNRLVWTTRVGPAQRSKDLSSLITVEFRVMPTGTLQECLD